MKYSYFPGCSLKGLGRAYEESLLPVMKHLGMELEELEDWNCCGATAYMSVDEAKAGVLAARNLAIAEKHGGHDLLTPCSACYLVLNKTKHNIQDFPDIRAKVQRALDTARLTYTGSTQVRHPLPATSRANGRKAPIIRLVRRERPAPAGWCCTSPVTRPRPTMLCATKAAPAITDGRRERNG
jgi:heterodisulfide reductase subunit B